MGGKGGAREGEVRNAGEREKRGYHCQGFGPHETFRFSVTEPMEYDSFFMDSIVVRLLCVVAVGGAGGQIVRVGMGWW